MANGALHSVVGATSGIGVAVYRARDQDLLRIILEAAGGGLGGYIGGRLPDLLEPAAGNPNHRNLAHSWLACGGTALGVANAAAWEHRLRAKAELLHRERLGVADPWQQAVLWVQEILLRLLVGFLTGAVAGYASHLVLDACTPQGLPLLAR